MRHFLITLRLFSKQVLVQNISYKNEFVLDEKCYLLLYVGYWPSFFGQDGWILAQFFFAFMDRDRVDVHKLAKKERGQYPAILTENT